jgi:2-C-methyl-D-erythritol 4-phosphate cytidylyltransferase
MGNVAAIIVAAGAGARMGNQPVPKQFLKVAGVPILSHTLRRFEDCPAIDHIILVVRGEDRRTCKQLISGISAEKVEAIVAGGKERQDSVFNGLLRVNQQTDVVLIHDAVRIFITEEIITTSIQYARKYGASVTAVPAKDTIKKVPAHTSAPHMHDESTRDDEHLFVSETLDRKELWHVQTPQTFQYKLILSVYKKAREVGIQGTDDAMLAEHFGHPVKIVYGSYRNIKITTPDDLLIAEAFLRDKKSNANVSFAKKLNRDD